MFEPKGFQLKFLDKALQVIPRNSIIIFDEFDRLGNNFKRKQFVDHIKSIADNYTDITLFFVGVSETVNDLIGEHPSLERNLTQIKLPLMEEEELTEICKEGIKKVQVKMEEDVIKRIVRHSCGYPHFTHLLCLNACKAALIEDSTNINDRHFKLAIQQSVEDAHESLNEAYQKATLATKDNIYAEVLSACSQVPLDEHGTFQASDIAPILSKIMQKDVPLNSYLYHLGKFCSEQRGNVLVSIGNKNIKRYKPEFK